METKGTPGKVERPAREIGTPEEEYYGTSGLCQKCGGSCSGFGEEKPTMCLTCKIDILLNSPEYILKKQLEREVEEAELAKLKAMEEKSVIPISDRAALESTPDGAKKAPNTSISSSTLVSSFKEELQQKTDRVVKVDFKDNSLVVTLKRTRGRRPAIDSSYEGFSVIVKLEGEM